MLEDEIPEMYDRSKYYRTVELKHDGLETILIITIPRSQSRPRSLVMNKLEFQQNIMWRK